MTPLSEFKYGPYIDLENKKLSLLLHKHLISDL